jgi:hypothetical protein
MNFLKAKRPFIESIGPVLERNLAWILAWILLPVTFYAIEIAPKDYPAWIFALVGLVFIWLYKSRYNPLMSLSTRKYLVLLIVLFISLRIIWIYYVPSTPFSDFAFYNNLAGRIAEFKPLTGIGWRGLNTYAWGYPVFLGLWYALVGNGLLQAKLLNILLGLAALIIFFKFATYFGEKIGRIAAFFFAIWPAQVMYTSVLGSEHLGMLAMLAAMLSLNKALFGVKHKIWYSALAGFFASLAYITRTGLLSLVLVSVLYILLFPLNFKQKIVHLAFFTSAIIITFGVFLFTLKTTYHVVPIANNLSTLLSGTNFESTGGWNLKDGKDYLKFNSVEEANAYAMKIARRRIINHPDQFILLINRKIPKMWGDERYGFQWSMMELASQPPVESFTTMNTFLEGFSQYYYVFILVFNLVGCVRIGLKKYSNVGNVWLLSFILLAILFHAVFEAQPRYHFPFTPFFFLLAAQGISGISLSPSETEQDRTQSSYQTQVV